jgi:aminomethyltransferase
MASSQPTPANLFRTPLFELAREHQARFTPFSGWEMPVQYSSLKLEHQAVRDRVGMFDISHMGKFTLQGKDLIAALQTLVPSDLARLSPGEAQYTVLLNPLGGIIDDIIFYYQGTTTTGEQQGVAIVNAGTAAKDKAWLLEHLPTSVTLGDISEERILIALQGPEAAATLQTLVAEDLSDLSAFTHRQVTLDGATAFIARTGYTGEDGFEIMLEPVAGKNLWKSLFTAGVVPCGLGARDTLRLEAAMSLYGQDIDETTTPLEAGLGWLVHLDSKGDFIGRKVLERQKSEGLQRRLVGLQMSGKYIARHGYPIMFEGRAVGEITSGTLAPTLGKAIALAYVPQALSKVGTELEVEIRGKTHAARVVKKPFYRSPYRQ